jgi:hypothetical protein
MIRFALIFLMLVAVNSQAFSSNLSISEGKKLLKENTRVINQYSKNKRVVAIPESYDNERIVYVSETIMINRDVEYDGDGKLFVWVGRGNCGQYEGMPPMFILLYGAKLKNLYMAYAPAGIHIRGSNVSIDNVINLEVCEDAVSINRAYCPENISITNSKFINCEDKGLQFDNGENITVVNNSFLNCKQPIRIHSEMKVYEARNNVMTGVADYYYLRSKTADEKRRKC